LPAYTKLTKLGLKLLTLANTLVYYDLLGP
jgi:hypothetical protein